MENLCQMLAAGGYLVLGLNEAAPELTALSAGMHRAETGRRAAA